jgi:hypothetical protein
VRIDLGGIPGYFKDFMALLYVVTGAFLIFSDLNILSISKTYRISLGIVLLIYGFYRAYRAFRFIREQDEK